MHDITKRLNLVQQRIIDAVKMARREPGSVKLLAVSKTRPIEDIEAVLALGLRDFGESYIQDALPKIEKIGSRATWHFIGPIQSNKTRAIAESFDWVHSIDRLKIATRLNEQRPGALPPLNVCLQIKTSDEPDKAGVMPEQALTVAKQIDICPNLRLRGLMTIPARETEREKQRTPFRLLHEIFNEIKQSGIDLDTLSMGMSNDLEAAILEGATVVRVGTAIFGARLSR